MTRLEIDVPVPCELVSALVAALRAHPESETILRYDGMASFRRSPASPTEFLASPAALLARLAGAK